MITFSYTENSPYMDPDCYDPVNFYCEIDEKDFAKFISDHKWIKIWDIKYYERK